MGFGGVGAGLCVGVVGEGRSRLGRDGRCQADSLKMNRQDARGPLRAAVQFFLRFGDKSKHKARLFGLGSRMGLELKGPDLVDSLAVPGFAVLTHSRLNVQTVGSGVKRAMQAVLVQGV